MKRRRPRRRNPLQHEGDERPTAARLTLARVREELRPLGLVVKRSPEGETVVNFRSGKEATAYYTNDLDDALQTGRAMAARPKRHAPRPRKRNPSPAWSGHSSARGGRLFGRRVLRVEYENVADGARVVRYHDFGPGVQMFALGNGTVQLRHKVPGKRVWDDFPDTESER